MVRRLTVVATVATMGVLVALCACDRSGHATKQGGAGVDTPLLWLGGATPPVPPGTGAPPLNVTVIPNAVIPTGSTPAVGVTFELGFAEDIALTDFPLHGAFWRNANALLWQVTEGQTYIDTVNMTDYVVLPLQPCYYSNDVWNGTFSAPGYDVMVYNPPQWNTVGTQAFVSYGPGMGRDGRVMALQTTSTQNDILHEVFHFLYILSWRFYLLGNNEACLDDEYTFTPDDTNCVMEDNFAPPLRLCSGGTLPAGNHMVSGLSAP